MSSSSEAEESSSTQSEESSTSESAESSSIDSKASNSESQKSSDGEVSEGSGGQTPEKDAWADGQTFANQALSADPCSNDAASLSSGRGRVVWELCCSPDSLITQCALALGFSAERLTLETGWDFRKRKHGRRACRLASGCIL